MPKKKISLSDDFFAVGESPANTPADPPIIQPPARPVPSTRKRSQPLLIRNCPASLMTRLMAWTMESLLKRSG